MGVETDPIARFHPFAGDPIRVPCKFSRIRGDGIAEWIVDISPLKDRADYSELNRVRGAVKVDYLPPGCAVILPSSQQCPGGCPDDCARCGSGVWNLMCDDCRSYAAQDAEPADA